MFNQLTGRAGSQNFFENIPNKDHPRGPIMACNNFKVFKFEWTTSPKLGFVDPIFNFKIKDVKIEGETGFYSN